MKQKIFLTIKTMIITVFILSFFLALFVAFNEGKKKIDGEGVFVYLTKNALYLRKGAREVKIEPDKKKLSKSLNFVYDHPFALPFPFNFLVFSNSLTKSFL